MLMQITATTIKYNKKKEKFKQGTGKIAILRLIIYF